MPYGLLVCPPRPDQPLIDSKDRKFAHSERFVLPRMTAPPARKFAATVESWFAGFPTSANEPALVELGQRRRAAVTQRVLAAAYDTLGNGVAAAAATADAEALGGPLDEPAAEQLRQALLLTR